MSIVTHSNMPLLEFSPRPLQSRRSAIVRDRDRHRAAIADVAAINVAVVSLVMRSRFGVKYTYMKDND